MDIAGFPGVVGVIDGTHICIITPSENEDVFVNRKRFHSINTQLVFSADYKILDIVAKWPGSTHDARILSESGLKQLFEGHYVPVNCHLLGDSGYPCKPWLLTPYLRPDPGPQLNYNKAHKKTRSVVERGIGQLKRRFHVLHGEVRLSPAKVCKVITACA
ncbi:putative nuclease HARBI1 [Brienomyrus brachyistius]|uniref:putative nuclease HARBI1 n=1 Tax=Brienomyrus brachyistius TaxID=42636 RepID=UPI0020B2C14F|nr:putative nuclease HARBI1 [Brienomyrus brachyistius]